MAWACELYAGLVGHCGKRNRTSLTHLDPTLVDSSLLSELAARYGGTLYDADTDLGGMPGAADASLMDEFAAAGIETPLDLRARFEPNFYFGCEADDRLAALAFDSAKLPFGARLKATFSSDIGHWDVPDMNRVLEEAYELCEDGLFSAADFRDFTFTHPRHAPCRHESGILQRHRRRGGSRQIAFEPDRRTPWVDRNAKRHCQRKMLGTEESTDRVRRYQVAMRSSQAAARLRKPRLRY